ncbi:MAG: hypothetical protein R6V32_07740 [Bacteroidales bacterium]
MHTFNLRSMEAYPYEQRDKNVLYKTDHFKTRIIELKEGEKLPPDEPCEMDDFVVFYLVSFIANKQKSLEGMKRGVMQFLKLLPTLLSVIILVSIAMYFIPEKTLITYFGDQAGVLGYVSAALVGSVSLIPGFIPIAMIM